MSTANADQGSDTGMVWIGLQLSTNNNYTFVWTDGSCVDYLNWATTLPINNQNNMCVLIFSDTSAAATAYFGSVGGQSAYYQKWNNYPCTNPMRAFVCKGLIHFEGLTFILTDRNDNMINKK